jgi:hypothetical protein
VILRQAALVTLVALAACGGGTPPPEEAPSPPPEPAAVAAPAPPPPPAVPLDPCEALKKPLDTLRALAAVVGLGRSMPVRPLYPSLFVTELDGDAARARAVKAGDPVLGKLSADAAARLATIAANARALDAAKTDAAAEAARGALLDEMERGEMLPPLADDRCGKHESLSGRIPVSALQRVVRGSWGEMRKCYEAGLRRNRSLSGAVRVRFVVARDGTVSEARDVDRGPPDPIAWGTGAGVPAVRDAEVSACVVEAFRRLVFPKPSGGTFATTYAIELGTGG